MKKIMNYEKLEISSTYSHSLLHPSVGRGLVCVCHTVQLEKLSVSLATICWHQQVSTLSNRVCKTN